MNYLVKAYKDWKLHLQFQEIVPDMDDEFMFNEKLSIRDSARTLKKYGSTCCNHSLRNNETLIRHEIQKTDTLQGIALKYGCTTEQIRRINRLFASDSLFLRQFLLIPVDKESTYFPRMISTNTIEENNHSLESNNAINEYDDPLNCTLSSISSTSVSSSSATSTENCSSIMATTLITPRPYSIAGEFQMQTNDQIMKSSSSSNSSNNNNNNHKNNNCNKQSKSMDSVAAAVSNDEDSRRSINEFLTKIDNTILKSRKYFEKSTEMISGSQSDHDLFTNSCVTAGTSNSYHKYADNYKNHNNHHTSSNSSGSSNNISTINHHIRQSSTGSNNSDTMQLLNTTQMRRVKNSLKRLEKQQDEFFEL